MTIPRHEQLQPPVEIESITPELGNMAITTDDIGLSLFSMARKEKPGGTTEISGRARAKPTLKYTAVYC